MRGQILYPPQEIETEPLQRKIMVHMFMHYRCDCCGRIFRFYLEKGLEDKMQDEIEPDKHKPVPFCVPCLCGGTLEHVYWNHDIHFNGYHPIKDQMNYFENTEEHDCGIPHIRNYGSEYLIDKPNVEFMKAAQQLEEAKEKIKDFQDAFNERSEDNPHGLQHVSTSVLKAELRRRKRWK